MDAPTPKLDCVNEIRFAVVMYGGVSLAIYINGVTQELLDMVRATSPATADGNELLLSEKELTGAMPIYRRLGQFLESRDRAGLLPTRPEPSAGAGEDEWRAWKSAPVQTRFIVDVISGTSAGGINGIFLSKALANNQALVGLKQMWISEGDLAKLLNDRLSVADLRQYGMSVLEPRQSLLNSQRMYRQLLKAFHQMEEAPAPEPEGRSPLVAELDLFVTTTDIEGIPLPIKLADNLIYERRHRNVFHFRYEDPGENNGGESRDHDTFNDFVKVNDPFLAYAARCTSSFPFAFEPMRLCDIRPIVEKFEAGSTYDISDNRIKKWEKFFSEYLRSSVWNIRRKLANAGSDDGAEANRAEMVERFWQRSFGDGGYLDNKPFSHATAMLMRRTASVPVDRKLVYIEPAPEHPERLPESSERPDFLQNINAALGLPRHETIREDLDRLFERNQVLERVNALAKKVDWDLDQLPFKYDDVLSAEQFQKSGLAKLINLYGVSFATYHRLKLEEVTAMLAERTARATGFDPTSEEGDVVRQIMQEWRAANFAAEPTATKRSENEFLYFLDLRYCLRRIGFTARRINEISRLDERALELITIAAREAWAPTRADTILVIEKQLANDPEWKRTFLDELKVIKKTKVSNVMAINRSLEERLHIDPIAINGESAPTVTLRDLAAPIFNWKCLELIMSASREDRARKLGELVKAKAANFRQLELFFRKKFRPAGGLPVGTPQDLDFHDARVVARRVIEHFRRKFPLYDLVTYPVVFASGAGETNIVKVSRISPEDAVALGKEGTRPREKLAGSTMMNFGAFLQRAWRQNDMLWGRLDGAERLICAVFEAKTKDEEKVRQELIMEAQVGILKEELNPADRETVARLITEFVSQMEHGTGSEKALRRLIEANLGDDKTLSGRVDAVLRSALKEPKQLWEFYRESFEVDRRIDAENAVRLIARSTDIVGRMLQQLAEAKKVDPAARIAKRIAMLGRIFWHAVEVAVPRSLPQLFFQHWIALLYVFDFVFIVGGILFGRPEVKNFGWLLLALTLTANVIVSALTEYLAGRETIFRVVRIFVGGALVALVTGGFLYFGSHLTQLNEIEQLVVASVAAAALLLLLALAEWRRQLRLLPVSAKEGVHWEVLIWLGAATAVCMVVLRILEIHAGIHQGEMVRFELAGNAASANHWLGIWPVEKVRYALWVDFLFVISYSAFLATACFRAARLWQLRANIGQARDEKTPREGRTARSAASIRWLRGAAIMSLSMGWLQWLAGGLDVLENVALLAFLQDRNFEVMPWLARHAAIAKFSLVIAGCLCGSAGFLFAPVRSWKTRVGYIIFALLVGWAGWVFGNAFVQALAAGSPGVSSG
jgi:patatin-related protein